ncbi:MAG: hypothetical protein D6820_01120, partial [Lentisphaerae bacterium]
MSLINRVEISNFIPLFGPDASDDEWMPKFRYNLFDFGSQSAAISMDNGTGKTSFSDAVIGLLTRDRGLCRKTREKMAPSSCGTYSHIRVELKVPRQASGNDMFVVRGHEVPGETWVFGMCGFRGKPETLSFYYYCGRLEDCPIAEVDGFKVSLYHNSDFREIRSRVSGLKFNVTTSDWLEAMTPHFPPHLLKQMAKFQAMGGGDTASSIYDVKPQRGERYDAAFFYSVIAPEVMAGAMSGDEDDEGDEHY